MTEFACIGHRGACGYEPENTLRAFSCALEMGVDALELDVYRVENELLVIHDERLDRTTNGRGLLSTHSLFDLRQLDAGKGEKIPLLREVFDLVAGKVWINVELKGAGTAEPVIDLIREYLRMPGWRTDHFLLSSFDPQQLRHAKKIAPDLRTGVLYDRIPEDAVERATAWGVYSVNPSLRAVSQAFVENAHAAGLKVFVYTVNTEDETRRLRDWGVDGVFTNFPDRCKKLEL